MTLKTAALALIGMVLLMILLAADFIKIVLGVGRDVLPALALFRFICWQV